jgi:hypothetical protein
VAEVDEGVGEVGHDALGAAVELGRHRFVERRHQRDARAVRRARTRAPLDCNV